MDEEFKCPYCGHVNTVSDLQEYEFDYDEDEVECEKCGKFVKITIQSSIFYLITPFEEGKQDA